MLSQATPTRTSNEPGIGSLLREPITIAIAKGTGSGSIYNTAGITEPMFKGKARWMHMISSGNALDTADNKTWICVVSAVTTTNPTPAIIIGPFDGSTTPVF
jgi:hypothetical protein